MTQNSETRMMLLGNYKLIVTEQQIHIILNKPFFIYISFLFRYQFICLHFMKKNTYFNCR